MEVVENTLPVPLATFLDRPLFAHLATVADGGAPRDTPVWYRWEEGALWVLLNSGERTVDDRVRADPRTSVGIVDFDPVAGRVQHVGMRGTAEVVEHDPDRAIRLLSRYLGPDRDAWDEEKFGDPRGWGDEMVQLRFEPDTVVARDQSYRGTLSVERSPRDGGSGGATDSSRGACRGSEGVSRGAERSGRDA